MHNSFLIGCARELLEIGAVLPEQATALLKMSSDLSSNLPPAARPKITQEEAMTSLNRLHTLDNSAMTGEQAHRGAVLGATIAPAIDVTKRLVAGDPAFGARTRDALKAFRGIPAGGAGKYRALAKVPVMAARSLAGSAVAGGLTGSAIPVVKNEVERGAERGKLRQFLTQEADVPTQI